MAGSSKNERELATALENRTDGTVAYESTICAFLVMSAFTGNAVLCLSLYKIRGFRAPQNYYITCLAVADMLFAFVCMSFSLGALIKGKWIFGDAWCQVQGSLIFIFVDVSLFTMTLIAINRYFKICKPMSVYQRLYSKRNILLSIILAWIASIAVVVALFSFTNKPFRFHPGKYLCFPDMAHSKGVHRYTLCAYLSVSAVTFPTMTFCYFRVYKNVREHFADIAKSGLVTDASRSFVNEAKISKMLFITVAAALGFWTPSICLDLYETIHQQYSLPRQVYYWQIISFTCGSVVNPIIYGFMRKELRRAYKSILTCKLSR